MNFRRFPLCLPLLIVFVGSLAAETLPEFRPALIGHHRKALINLINVRSLMERGQKDGTVMFETGISELGQGYSSRCFRGSPNTELLQKEVMGQIDQAQFEAAVYRHTHVTAYIQGTVMFLIHDGKPMVRIFLNQDENEIKAGHDFIAPQYCFATGNTAFRNFTMPLPPGGVAVVGLDIDATGHVTGRKMVYEYPPGMNYGNIILSNIGEALFIPGFRNGKPTACHFNWTAVFRGAGKSSKTG